MSDPWKDRIIWAVAALWMSFLTERTITYGEILADGVPPPRFERKVDSLDDSLRRISDRLRSIELQLARKGLGPLGRAEPLFEEMPWEEGE